MAELKQSEAALWAYASVFVSSFIFGRRFRKLIFTIKPLTLGSVTRYFEHDFTGNNCYMTLLNQNHFY